MPAFPRSPRPPRPPRVVPSSLRRPRVLIVGCGDVGARLLRALSARLPRRLHAIAVTRDPSARNRARALGARALAVDLDDRRSIRRLGALGRWTLHLAPPQPRGDDDLRFAALLAAARPALHAARLRTGAFARARWVYLGTTGVYGDASGERVDETRRIAPASARARRRAAAESRLRSLARDGLASASILRAPALYAHDRLPIERLRRGDPVPHVHEDVFVNHVHADDLARIAWLALFRGRPARIVHAADGEALRLGAWLERIARALGEPAPPRASRTEIAAAHGGRLPRVLVESRRLDPSRLVGELRYRLRWPRIDSVLADLRRRRGSAL